MLPKFNIRKSFETINKGFCDAAKALFCIWLIINKYGETAFVFGIIHVLSKHL